MASAGGVFTCRGGALMAFGVADIALRAGNSGDAAMTGGSMFRLIAVAVGCLGK